MYWKRSNPNCNGNRRGKVALRPPALKFQIEDYENKDRLSVCRIFSLQRTPKPGRTKPSTGPGLDIAGLDTGATMDPERRRPIIWARVILRWKVIENGMFIHEIVDIPKTMTNSAKNNWRVQRENHLNRMKVWKQLWTFPWFKTLKHTRSTSTKTTLHKFASRRSNVQHAGHRQKWIGSDRFVVLKLKTVLKLHLAFSKYWRQLVSDRTGFSEATIKITTGTQRGVVKLDSTLSAISFDTHTAYKTPTVWYVENNEWRTTAWGIAQGRAMTQVLSPNAHQRLQRTNLSHRATSGAPLWRLAVDFQRL